MAKRGLVTNFTFRVKVVRIEHSFHLKKKNMENALHQKEDTGVTSKSVQKLRVEKCNQASI